MVLVHRPRTLLLTLDAFNTIFHPRQPIPTIYTRVAQELDVIPPSISLDVVKPAFKTAFKRNIAKYPNYGRDTPGFGGPRAWWGTVIRECFAEVKGHGTASDIPDRLVQALLSIFQSDLGYKLYNDVEPFFQKLQMWRNMKKSSTTMLKDGGNGSFDRIVLGVISNSDDRVPDILRSLGLRVGSAWADNGDRLPSVVNLDGATKRDNDIDLIVTSYEAGKEKPHKHIFNVAQKRAEEHLTTTGFIIDPPFLAAPYDRCVHVGDDYRDDYQGAMNAGWDGFLLLREDVDVPESAHKLSNSISNLDDLFPLLGMENHEGKLV